MTGWHGGLCRGGRAAHRVLLSPLGRRYPRAWGKHLIDWGGPAFSEADISPRPPKSVGRVGGRLPVTRPRCAGRHVLLTYSGPGLTSGGNPPPDPRQSRLEFFLFHWFLSVAHY